MKNENTIENNALVSMMTEKGITIEENPFAAEEPDEEVLHDIE